MNQCWQIRFIQALSVVGLIVAFYLHLFHSGDLIIACGEESWLSRYIVIDCYNVSGPTASTSSISLGGKAISIALIGLLGYAGIFGTIWLGDLVNSIGRYVRELVASMVILGFLFSVWLTWVEATQIGAYCLYCLYSAAVIFVMLILTLTMFIPKRSRG